MTRTALELTTEEWQAYRLARKPRERQAEERFEQAWEIARRAAHLLRERFGATRVVAFGSLAHRAWFHSQSDIDLAAWGMPAAQFYRAVAAVTGLSPDFEVNLVDPESCWPAVCESIEREGIEL
jgi:predicted nucleotidyltransferase